MIGVSAGITAGLSQRQPNTILKISDARRGTTSPAADTQLTRITQTTVGNARGRGAAVSSEYPFFHIGNLAVIHGHVDGEGRTTVLTQEFTHVIHQAI